MKGITVLAAVLLCLVAAACATPALPDRGKKSGVMRVGFPSQADTSDVPSLMAHDLLRSQGYTIETTFFGSPDLEVAALANGDIDFSNGSTRTHWAAIQKGAKLWTIAEQAGDPWSLVTRIELKTCADLQAKKIAVNSAGSISKALLDAYIVLDCPTVKPEILFIAGSDNRAAAMQANELNGALLETADVLQLAQQAPGKYHALINFADALPKLKTNAVYVNQTFGSQHADMVRDYLAALLTIHRQLATNPQSLYDAMVADLKLDKETAQQVGDAYLARQTWNPNGGMDAADLQYTIDFFVNTGGLDAGLSTAQVSNLAFLDAALEQIGRK